MIWTRILFAIGALLIGALGIVPLFSIGEGTGSGILAYAADTLIFGLVAYGLSWVDRGVPPLYAVMVCLPVLLLSMGGAGSGEAFLALLMTAICAGAAYLASGMNPAASE